MTRYGFEPHSGSVWASWPTGRGPLTARVIDDGVLDDVIGPSVARDLERLSDQLWLTYTDHEPSDTEPGPARWRTHDAAELLGTLVRTGALPMMSEPVSDGAAWVLALGFHLGSGLRAAGVHHRVIEQVACEVERETTAVTDAQRGELTGRAEQAVALGSADPSPQQVAAAEHLLLADPLSPADEFATLDPSAAAVAAAHVLAAAAAVAADHAALPLEQVMHEADTIEPMPRGTPTSVIERIAGGHSPRRVVVDLLLAARRAGRGELADPALVLAHLRDAANEHENAATLRTPAPPRICLLDPTRPAMSLLEDLTLGIRGCWLVYRQATETPPDPTCSDFCAAVVAVADHHGHRVV